MSTNEKKEFLDLYLLQQVKINRLNYLIKENPSRKERYISQINAAEALRERIELAIENIDGGILSEVLCQKYLCGKSLEETALTLNFSKRHTERLFIKAIELVNI